VPLAGDACIRFLIPLGSALLQGLERGNCGRFPLMFDSCIDAGSPAFQEKIHMMLLVAHVVSSKLPGGTMEIGK